MIEHGANVGNIRIDGGQVVMQSKLGYTLNVGVLQFASKFSNHEIDLRKTFGVLVGLKPFEITLELIQ